MSIYEKFIHLLNIFYILAMLLFMDIFNLMRYVTKSLDGLRLIICALKGRT